MKSILQLSVLGIATAAFFASCNTDKTHPGYIFMPDMTYSNAGETYSESAVFNKDSMTSLLPVANTIPRGFMPFHYEESTEEYERAGRDLVNPYPVDAAFLENGKYNFEIYCAVCHGSEGKGNGTIVERGVYPPPPSYFSDVLINLPIGKMFYSVHFGKNAMGSYKTQLNQKERWQVVEYVKSMQTAYLGVGSKTDSTSTKTDSTTTAAK